MSLISVIIPIYNQKKHLSRSIESVLNQSFKNLEIILVNDGSTDGSEKIIEEYAAKDKRIVTLHKENGGLSSARNAGIKISTGKYICFLDSDDYVDVDAYEKMHELITKYNADIACIGVEVFSDNGHIRYFNENLNEELILNKLEALHYHAISENKYISTSSCDKIFKREIVLSKLFQEGQYYEDLRVISYWINSATKIVYKNIPLYHYYYNNDSITHGKFNPKWLTWIDANEERLELYRKEDPEDIKYLNNTYVDNVLSIIYQARKNKKIKAKIKEIELNLKIFYKNNNNIEFSKKAKYKLKLYRFNKYLYFFAMNIYNICRKK